MCVDRLANYLSHSAHLDALGEIVALSQSRKSKPWLERSCVVTCRSSSFSSEFFTPMAFGMIFPISSIFKWAKSWAAKTERTFGPWGPDERQWPPFNITVVHSSSSVSGPPRGPACTSRMFLTSNPSKIVVNCDMAMLFQEPVTVSISKYLLLHRYEHGSCSNYSDPYFNPEFSRGSQTLHKRQATSELFWVWFENMMITVPRSSKIHLEPWAPSMAVPQKDFVRCAGDVKAKSHEVGRQS